MSLLLSAHSLSKSFGPKELFQDLSLTFQAGDRVGLIGPNGAGKSTLLKILCGLDSPDQGEVTKKKELVIGYAGQHPEFPQLSVEEVLLKERKDEVLARVLLSQAQFTDFAQDAKTLSGGWKKRLDIIRALMKQPDILFLDEPTNHLDLEGILWLENFLQKKTLSFVVISHDRYFLENVTTKIIEINPCYPEGLFSVEGTMSEFIERKEQRLSSQIERAKALTSMVRSESEWLRRSPKARTTKSESRIKRAYHLIDELHQTTQRTKEKRAAVSFTATGRETRRLLAVNNLKKALGGKELFSGVTFTLSPGSRLGIVGDNGTGKTTLLKILAGIVSQDSGTVKYADDLRLVYFDQHREEIPLDATLKEALSPRGEYVNYLGRDIHVNGWAERFLFSKERLGLPVRMLSGGERARIQIAKLMLEPADVLFLDEPTNDLDIQTLEIMEESLKEFPGALVLITHDRCMMDRICSELLGLGRGAQSAFYADYSQWEGAASLPEKKSEEKEVEKVKKSKSLSYHEKKELGAIEEKVLLAEERVEKLNRQILDNPSQALYDEITKAQQEVDKLYERWQELVDKNSI